MSTIKSSTEHLTLNADGAGKDIKFQANGVEKASIDSSGNFTSTSIDATKLSGTVPNFTSTGIDDNATSTAITIDASENVGIGTSSPAAKLHVDNGTGAALYVGLANNIYYRGAEHIWQSQNNTAERMRIDSNGWMHVGVTSGGGRVNMKATTNNFLSEFYNQSGGSVGAITTNGSSTAYNTTSDYRLKENVVPMSASIDRLKQLKPSRFNFISDADKTVDGFLAHEAGEVVPECVSGTKDAMMTEEYEVTPAVMDGETVVTEAVMGTRSVPDYQGIDQSKLVPLLVASLQEAVEKIEALEARVTALEV